MKQSGAELGGESLKRAPAGFDPEHRLVVSGAAALTLGMVAIPFASSVPLPVPAMLIVALGVSLMTPSLNSLETRSPAERPTPGAPCRS